MKPTIAIVLGATRGIGRALAKCLALRLASHGYVYITARNASDGEQTQRSLALEGVAVGYLVFDLSDPAAPSRVADQIAARHSGVDIVVQNGAYMPRAGVPAAEDARPMIAANSHGTLRVLRAFLPILRPHGRMIVVASSLGVLSNLPEALRHRLVTTNADPDAINKAMDDYVDSVEAGRAEGEGWPEWVNIPSKVGQVAVTRAFAKAVKQDGSLPRGALINIANPGVTLTDATRDFMGTVFRREHAQTPEAAAKHIADLALLASATAGPYGELVERGRVIAFGD